jgi:Recombination endonuclease VII
MWSYAAALCANAWQRLSSTLVRVTPEGAIAQLGEHLLCKHLSSASLRLRAKVLLSRRKARRASCLYAKKHAVLVSAGQEREVTLAHPFTPPVSRKLPPSWTARARQAARELHPPELVRRVGDPASPMRYTVAKNRPVEWRVHWANTSLCAVASCEVTGYGHLVLDHCHDHGWVRGLICASHNIRLGQIDAVLKIPGVRLDLSATPYAALLSACPDCLLM